METEVGKVVHWYDRVSVAVAKLSEPLSIGDKIKVRRGEEVFEDTVSSMQLDHKDISTGKKGQEVAVKLSQKANEGAVILKLS